MVFSSIDRHRWCTVGAGTGSICDSGVQYGCGMRSDHSAHLITKTLVRCCSGAAPVTGASLRNSIQFAAASAALPNSPSEPTVASTTACQAERQANIRMSARCTRHSARDLHLVVHTNSEHCTQSNSRTLFVYKRLSAGMSVR